MSDQRSSLKKQPSPGAVSTHQTTELRPGKLLEDGVPSVSAMTKDFAPTGVLPVPFIRGAEDSSRADAADAYLTTLQA